MNEVEHKVQKDTEVFQVGLSKPDNGDWKSRMGWSSGPLTFLCLNDDIKDTGKLRERIDELLVSFFDRMWPNRMGFERQD
jgi:hypothetical protein